MREDAKSASANGVSRNHLPGTADCDTGIALDELNSAATPFLYLLASVLIAVAAYFVYTYLHG